MSAELISDEQVTVDATIKAESQYAVERQLFPNSSRSSSSYWSGSWRSSSDDYNYGGSSYQSWGGSQRRYSGGSSGKSREARKAGKPTKTVEPYVYKLDSVTFPSTLMEALETLAISKLERNAVYIPAEARLNQTLLKYEKWIKRLNHLGKPDENDRRIESALWSIGILIADVKCLRKDLKGKPFVVQGADTPNDIYFRNLYARIVLQLNRINRELGSPKLFMWALLSELFSPIKMTTGRHVKTDLATLSWETLLGLIIDRNGGNVPEINMSSRRISELGLVIKAIRSDMTDCGDFTKSTGIDDMMRYSLGIGISIGTVLARAESVGLKTRSFSESVYGTAKPHDSAVVYWHGMAEAIKLLHSSLAEADQHYVYEILDTLYCDHAGG